MVALDKNSRKLDPVQLLEAYNKWVCCCCCCCGVVDEVIVFDYKTDLGLFPIVVSTQVLSTEAIKQMIASMSIKQLPNMYNLI